MNRARESVPPGFRTFLHLLQARAHNQPAAPACTFLADGETPAEARTYGDLYARARAVGAALQQRGLAGERVLLLLPAGCAFLDAFLGVLYAGAVAVPAPPPDGARQKRARLRLATMAADCQPRLVLTTAGLGPLVERVAAEVPELAALPLAVVEELAGPAGGPPPDMPSGDIAPTDLAYLQYTSGSTSAPRGVRVSHGNLLHNSAGFFQRYAWTPDSRAVSWMPNFHDFGLVEGLLQPLYAGVPSYLLSPLTLLKKPHAWLAAISRYRASHSAGPSFAFEHCVRRITPEQRADLDLSCWRVATLGAEPIRPQVLAEFAATFGPCGFRTEAFAPGYGLAEATLMVSLKPAAEAPRSCTLKVSALQQGRVEITGDEDGPESRRLVSCGPPGPGMEVVVADPESRRRCPAGHIGELWVRGASVADGYWQQPEATAATFGAELVDEPAGEMPAGPFLRTGDLGFLHDGELFVTGRCKDLILVQGQNYYPQDLELTAERSHPCLRPGSCVAFAVEDAGEERAVIVQEVERSFRDADPLQVLEALRQAVAEEHGVPLAAVLLVRSGTLAKTSSGKVQRRDHRRTPDHDSSLRSRTVSPRACPASASRRPSRSSLAAGRR